MHVLFESLQGVPGDHHTPHALLAFSEHHEQHLGWVSPTLDDSIIVLSSLTHATQGVQWVDAMASVLVLTPTPRY